MQPIHIKLTRSGLLLMLLLAISFTNSIILLALPFAPMVKLLAILVIIVSCVYYMARDALLILPSSWQFLNVNAKGELTITNKRGVTYEPALAASSFIHAKLIILNFQSARFKWAIPSVLMGLNLRNTDEMQHELRRLRVYLRWFQQK